MPDLIVDNLRVIDAMWFGEGLAGGIPHTVGIVTVEDNYGNRKAYIGIGNGHNQKVDTVSIVRYGTRFHAAVLESLKQQLKIP